MELDNFIEMAKDAYGYIYYLNLYFKIKNANERNIYRLFISEFISYFYYEIVDSFKKTYNYDVKNFFKDEQSYKHFAELRHKIMHHTFNDNMMDEIIDKEGIDFNFRTFDCYVGYNKYNNEVILKPYSYLNTNLPINWSRFYIDTEKISNEILKILWFDKKFYLIIKKMLKKKIKKCLNYTKQLSYSAYTYSYYDMFKEHELLDEEKKFIIDNYNRIYVVKKLWDLLIDNSLNLKIITKSDINVAYYDIKYFLKKCKAVAICHLKTNLDKLSDNSKLKNQIQEYANSIDGNFFIINRKLRNNIHYSKVDRLSNDEFEILDKYQNDYIDYILNLFKENMNIKITKEIEYVTQVSKELSKIKNDKLRNNIFEKRMKNFYKKNEGYLSCNKG